MYYIGVDLGTSAVKLVLMRSGGKIVRTVSREYPLSFPRPGWSEQEPEDWWNAVVSGMPELIEHVDVSEVAGISFGGQMHGLVILDAEDNVIRPAILWNDGRTGEETEYLNTRIGKQALSDYTGNIAFAGFTAPKLLWLSKHEPDNFAKISKIMLPKDYLAYKMTGIHSCDYSDASGMLLLDVKNKCWSKEMLEICDIKSEQLPKLYESYEVTGTLTEEAAGQLGLSTLCKVAAGAGDNAAGAVGTGTVGNGECTISLGTSGTIFISSDECRVDSSYALHSFAHADGRFHLMGCILSAASCNKWWMDEIIGEKDYEKEQSLIDNKKPGSNSVFFLPYLMGERCPHNDPDARALFLGMSMDTTRSDMTLAVLEGVAFAMRDCLELAKKLGIEVNAAKLCGGGAKSPLWRKIMANVLNVPMQFIESEEGPGYGAAILAAVACGEYSSVQEASGKLVRVTETVFPEEKTVQKYEKKYQKYKKLYPLMREFVNETTI